MFDQSKQLAEIRQIRTELNSVPIVALRGAIRRLDKAFSAFFRRCNSGEKPGYPRFKGKYRFNSISIDDLGKKNPLVAGGKRLQIPLLGKIKIKLHRPVLGTPKALRLKREGNGKWYAVLACVDVPEQHLPRTNREVGIDLGLTNFITTSDGRFFHHPRALSRAEWRLRRAQRRLSRKKRRSIRWKRTKSVIAKLHYHVAQVRRQFAIDTANYLVRKYDSIYIEDLNVRALARTRLSKHIYDAGWSTLIHWLNVKAESAGRIVIKVDPRGTSQRCSGCGTVAKKELKDRVHDCKVCGLSLDRDLNAALNIYALGQSARRADSAVVEQR